MATKKSKKKPSVTLSPELYRTSGDGTDSPESRKVRQLASRRKARLLDVTAAENELEIIKLRSAGWTHSEIAERLNMTHEQVSRQLKTICQQVFAEEYRQADILRTITARQLDEQLRHWSQRAKTDPIALDRVIKLLVERSKLFGLDLPPQLSQWSFEGEDE